MPIQIKQLEAEHDGLKLSVDGTYYSGGTVRLKHVVTADGLLISKSDSYRLSRDPEFIQKLCGKIEKILG